MALIWSRVASTLSVLATNVGLVLVAPIGTVADQYALDSVGQLDDLPQFRSVHVELAVVDEAPVPFELHTRLRVPAGAYGSECKDEG